MPGNIQDDEQDSEKIACEGKEYLSFSWSPVRLTIFSYLDFPNLKSLKVDDVKLTSVVGIPAGLEVLSIETAVMSNPGRRSLLDRVAPTIQHLEIDAKCCRISFPKMPRLRRLPIISLPATTLIKLNNPNLRDLDVGLCDYKGSKVTTKDLLESFKSIPQLTHLVITDGRELHKDEMLTIANPLHLDAVLPQLQELTLYTPDNFCRIFLQIVGKNHLKELTVDNLKSCIEEIKLCQNLEILNSEEELDIEIVIEILESLPKLQEIKGKVSEVPLSGAMKLISYLKSNGRHLRGGKCQISSLI